MSSGKWNPFCSGHNSRTFTIYKWWPVCPKQILRAGTSNYIQRMLWDVITYPRLWCLLLIHLKSSYILCSLDSWCNPSLGHMIPRLDHSNTSSNNPHPSGWSHMLEERNINVWLCGKVIYWFNITFDSEMLYTTTPASLSSNFNFFVTGLIVC